MGTGVEVERTSVSSIVGTGVELERTSVSSIVGTGVEVGRTSVSSIVGTGVEVERISSVPSGAIWGGWGRTQTDQPGLCWPWILSQVRGSQQDLEQGSNI